MFGIPENGSEGVFVFGTNIICSSNNNLQIIRIFRIVENRGESAFVVCSNRLGRFCDINNVSQGKRSVFIRFNKVVKEGNRLIFFLCVITSSLSCAGRAIRCSFFFGKLRGSNFVLLRLEHRSSLVRNLYESFNLFELAGIIQIDQSGFIQGHGFAGRVFIIHAFGSSLAFVVFLVDFFLGGRFFLAILLGSVFRIGTVTRCRSNVINCIVGGCAGIVEIGVDGSQVACCCRSGYGSGGHGACIGNGGSNCLACKDRNGDGGRSTKDGQRSEGNGASWHGDLTHPTATCGRANVHSHTSAADTCGADGGIDVEAGLFLEFLDVDHHVTDVEIDEDVGGAGLFLDGVEIRTRGNFALGKFFDIERGVRLEGGHCARGEEQDDLAVGTGLYGMAIEQDLSCDDCGGR